MRAQASTVITAIALAVALGAGCSTTPSGRPDGARSAHPGDDAPDRPSRSGGAVPSRSSGWERVDVGGTIRAILAPPNASDAVVVGSRHDGGPLIATVQPALAAATPWSFPSLRTAHELATVASDGENTFVGTRTTPRAADGPELWSTYYDLTHPDLVDFRRDPLPKDGRGRTPVWAVPLVDGEEDYRVVGVTRSAAGTPEVHAWDEGSTRGPVIAGSLYLHADAHTPSLQVGNTETDIVVGGLLSTDARSAPRRPTVWRGAAATDQPGRWLEVPLSPRPDTITDIADWEVGYWVAGSSGGRPVVYDFDPGGPSFPPLDTRLDPRQPTVLFASRAPFLNEPPALVTQSVDGPTVWVAEGQHYRRFPAPGGHLDAAAMQHDTVYVVIDGVLWIKKLPPVVPGEATR